MQRNEHRAKPRGLADLLLPHALIEDGILLQQDGSLLTGWTYRGPDMMSAAPAEMDALSARLNSVLRLGSGWMLQCDAIRSRAPGYPEQGAFPDGVTRVMTTAIALETSKGDLPLALGLGIVLLTIVLALNAAADIVKDTAQRRYG